MTNLLDKPAYAGARYGKAKREKQRQQEVTDRRANNPTTVIAERRNVQSRSNRSR